jgi:glycosyltransferase involved in cell wall biosynthesis
MRFIVLDSGLRGKHGHHDRFARGFFKVMDGAGIAVRYLAMVAIEPDLARDCNATPFFNTHFYARLSTDRFDGLTVDAALRARSFENDLDKLGAEEVTDDDVVLMPTAGPAEIVALLKWRKKRGLKMRVAFLVHRPTAYAYQDIKVGSQLCSLWRSVHRSLKDIDHDQFKVIAMTQGLADRLTTLLEVPVYIQNSEQFTNRPTTPPVARHDGRLSVGFLGPIRHNKNLESVDQIAIEARALGLKLELVVQPEGCEGPVAEAGDVTIRRLLGWIDDDGFEDLIASLDLVALPYERSAYHIASSGICANAIALGRPVIVPSDTWMASMVEQGLASGVVYTGEGAAVIAAAIEEASRDIDRLRGQALERAPSWRRKFSGEGAARNLRVWARGNESPAPHRQNAPPVESAAITS